MKSIVSRSLLILLVLSLMLIPFANAQVSGMDGNPLTFILGNIIEMANDLGSKTVTMPIYGHQLSYLHLFLTWLILFSLMWVASGMMPPFNKDTSAAGARKTFAVAVSLLVTFGSPVAYYLFIFVSTWVTTFVVLGLIVLGWIMLKWLGRGQAHGAKYTAETKRLRNEGKAADNVVEDSKAAMNELRKLSNKDAILAKDMKETLIKLKRYLIAAKRAKSDSEQKADIESSITLLSSIMNYESQMIGMETKIAQFRTFFEKDEVKLIKDLKKEDVDEAKFADELKRDHSSITDENKVEEAKKRIDNAIEIQSKIIPLFRKWEQYDTYEKGELAKVERAILDLRQALRVVNIDASLKECSLLIGLLDLEERVIIKMEEFETEIEKLEIVEHKDLTDAISTGAVSP